MAPWSREWTGGLLPRGDRARITEKVFYPSRGRSIIGITEITSSRTYLLPDWVILEPREEELMSDRSAVVLKVTLDDPFGRAPDKPYRVLAVPGEWSLYDLAHLIVDSFDFDFDHMFGFYNNLRNYAKSTEGYEYFSDIGEGNEFGSVTETSVLSVFPEKGKKMLFLFDYGDHWCFTIKVEDVQDAEEFEDLPAVVKRVGEAPLQYGDMVDWDDEEDWSEDWDDDDWDYDWMEDDE